MANTKLPARLLDTSAVPALNVTGDLTVDTTTLKVDSTNNKVGIGIASSLDSTLHVADGTAQINIEGTSGDATLKLESTGNSYWNMFIDQSDARKLKFEDNGNGVALTIERDGDVGIGTSSPQDKLHVYDGDVGIENSSGKRYRLIAESNGGFTIRDQTAAAGRLSIDSSGNVGIGTSSPFSKVQSGTNTFSGNNGMYADSRVGISNHGELTGLMLASTYNDSSFPEYGLVFVQGPSTSSYNVWSISPDGPAAGDSLNFIYGSNSTNIHTTSPRVVFDGNGNVGIGTGTTSPSQRLEVNGNINVNGHLLANGARASNRGELHLNATGADDVAEIFFGYGDGFTSGDGNIRWGISDRGHSNGHLIFYEGPKNNGSFAEVASFTKTDGAFKVKNGLRFGSDTAAANTLDDYEEGQWTPTATTSNSDSSISVTVNYAKYIKVGGLVHASCYLSLSISNVGSGAAIIGGLPFVNTSGQGYPIASVGHANSIQSQGTNGVVAYVTNGHSYIRHVNVTDVGNVGWSGTGTKYYMMSCTYHSV